MYFTKKQRQQIFERDEYKCVLCGMGTREGLHIDIDLLMPDLGETTLSNGVVLCSNHHTLNKKTYNQTETGKKMFIRLLALALEAGDEKTASFCRDVLQTYEQHGINGHIAWHEGQHDSD